MEEVNTCQPVAVEPRKIELLSFGNLNNAYQKEDKNGYNSKHTDKTLLFTNGTKNKIGLLLRDEIEFCHRAFKIAFAL